MVVISIWFVCWALICRVDNFLVGGLRSFQCIIRNVSVTIDPKKYLFICKMVIKYNHRKLRDNNILS